MRKRMSSAFACTFAAVGIAAGLLGGGLSSGASTAANSSTNWTVYHGDAGGTGASSALRAVDTARRAWTSPVLNGELYGEPLVYDGRVYVATENDYAYALSATNGRVIWSRHLASPVPSSDLPCGDISPTVGVSGTPVIDPSRNEIYFVADELVGGGPEHKLIGLSTSSGALELIERVDTAGSTPSALLQRTGLNLTDGRVVFGMGGNYGDCASYRGRVGSVAEAGSAPLFYTVDARGGDSQGAVWMGGAAPVIDAHGDVWVGTGNGSVHTNAQPYDDGDAALDLTPTMHLKQFFAPATWAQDNASDFDMSTAPTLLSSGQVVLAGKSPRVYLLNGAHLGGIGHPERIVTGLCSNDIDGGSAIVGSTVFLPCVDGPVAVRASVTPASLRVLWKASVGGGPPIYAAGLVWTIGQNGVLYGLNPSNGQVRQQATIGAVANHFPTPSIGDSLLLVSSVDQVVAFRGRPN
ncbi:MAG TPA: PQQ-binding-like beta-propeller repeat protein [Acidimicrobiales bacterium]|nr:PQQ-binding-like beta-propeller repeat protein [Acidimicrobiales bacterium]